MPAGGFEELRELASDKLLEARVAETAHHLRARRIAVGVLSGDRVGSAHWGAMDDHLAGFGARLLRTGCITKLFTAALVLNSVHRGAFRLCDDVGKLLLRRDVPSAERLCGIRVIDLLEHTHGLDGSNVDAVLLRDDGFIDTERLCQAATAPSRLSPPGELCCYSDVGARLLGAILEKVWSRPYQAVLIGELLQPFGIDSSALTSVPICPSGGRGLRVPIEDFLRFVRDFSERCSVGYGAGEMPEVDPRRVVALAGWNSVEQGVQLGWKHYGSGWMGHNSEIPGAAAVVRVHPFKGVAIVLESGDQAPAPIMAALFGKLVPELVVMRIPRRLNTQELEDLQVDHYVGRYESDQVAVTVKKEGIRALELRAHRRHNRVDENTPFAAMVLQAAQDRLFLPKGPAATRLFPFVQFVGNGGPPFRYLWNGKSVWPRVPS